MERKTKILILLSFLIALGLTSYPLILRQWHRSQEQQSIALFEQEVFTSDKNKAVSETPASVGNSTLDSPDFSENRKQSELFEDLFAAMTAYNLNIWTNQQTDLDSVEDYETPSIDVRPYLGADTVGVISIPAMAVELPLYLGASKENMAKGAVVMGGTSCPIGGANTNCVIAAHRGYSGIPYFREIERLNVGDCVYITNPWETLTYIVTDYMIVSPDSLDLVHIQPDKDMITLVTCHPYRVGTQRYLVFCERAEASLKFASEGISEADNGDTGKGRVLISADKTAATARSVALEEPAQRLISTEEKLEYVAPLAVILVGLWIAFKARQNGV